MTNLEQLNEKEKRFIIISQRLGDTLFTDCENCAILDDEFFYALKGFCQANLFLLEDKLLMRYCQGVLENLFVFKQDCEKNYLEIFKPQYHVESTN